MRSTAYTNMRQFPIANHFAAWASVALGKRQSGAGAHWVRFATGLWDGNLHLGQILISIA